MENNSQFNKQLKITDQTLLYLLPNAKTAYVREYFKYMEDAGVRQFEINSVFKHHKFVDLRKLILRVINKEDIKFGKKNEIKKIVIGNQILNELFNEKINKEELLNYEITIEFETDEEVEQQEEYLLKIFSFIGKHVVKGFNIKTVRLCKIVDFSYNEMVLQLSRLFKSHGIELEVSTDESYYLSTTSAIDLADIGITSFCGSFGGIALKIVGNKKKAQQTQLAIEEFMTAFNILSSNQKFHLNFIQKIKEYFTEITGYQIDKYKPILGRDIFKYESGIHASGINIVPSTYEPFSPDSIGLERELCIGKHSGTGSIQEILRKNGIVLSKEFLFQILKKVREKSIEKKNSLDEEDLMEIYYSSNFLLESS